MASADFCHPIPTPYDVGSTRQDDRSPRVIRATFLPHTRRIYSATFPDDYRALKILAFSPRWNCLICDFCSSGRKFACGFLQIPPRGGHPCRSASGSRHQGPQRTFTSKSPISHHSRSDGACAPRAMPGAPKKTPSLKDWGLGGSVNQIPPVWLTAWLSSEALFLSAVRHRLSIRFLNT